MSSMYTAKQNTQNNCGKRGDRKRRDRHDVSGCEPTDKDISVLRAVAAALRQYPLLAGGCMLKDLKKLRRHPHLFRDALHAAILNAVMSIDSPLNGYRFHHLPEDGSCQLEDESDRPVKNMGVLPEFPREDSDYGLFGVEPNAEPVLRRAEGDPGDDACEKVDVDVVDDDSDEESSGDEEVDPVFVYDSADNSADNSSDDESE